MHLISEDVLKEEVPKKRKKLMKKLQKLEDFTDELEEEIARFLVKVSVDPLQSKSSAEIRTIFRTISDLERVADVYSRMAHDIRRMEQQNTSLNQGQVNNLLKMSNLIGSEIEKAKTLFENGESVEQGIEEIRDGLHGTIKELRNGQIARIEKENDYDVKAGIIYRDLYNGYDRIGELLYSVIKTISMQ